jgi:hypothetical protein
MYVAEHRNGVWVIVGPIGRLCQCVSESVARETAAALNAYRVIHA